MIRPIVKIIMIIMMIIISIRMNMTLIVMITINKIVLTQNNSNTHDQNKINDTLKPSFSFLEPSAIIQSSWMTMA